MEIGLKLPFSRVASRLQFKAADSAAAGKHWRSSAFGSKVAAESVVTDMKLTTLVRLILVAAMTAASLAIPGAASGCPCCDRLAADQAAASNDCCRMEPDRPHHAAVLGRAAQPVFTPQAPGGLSGHRLSADIVLVPVAGTVRSARDAYLRNSVLRI